MKIKLKNMYQQLKYKIMKTILKFKIIALGMLFLTGSAFAVPTAMSVSSVTPNNTCFGSAAAVTITFTRSGGTGNWNVDNVFTVEISDASGNFASPIVIGTLASRSANPILSTIPLNTPSGSGYKIRVRSGSPALISTNTVSFAVNQPAVTLGVFANAFLPATVYPLTGGSPLGGTYTGTGVSETNFNPTLAGYGYHIITYSYTDGNGCTNSDTSGIQVYGPNTQIRTEFCGIVLGNITDEVRAYSVAGANQYEYRLTEQGTGTILTYSYGIYKLKLAWVSGIKYNQTYSIEVRARIGAEWGIFSNSCNITTPIIPSPTVSSGQCGTTISSLTELIYFSGVNKATNYEYKLVEQGTSNTYTHNNTNYRVALAWFGSAIKYNTIYELQARAYVNGDWSDFSPICEVTTPDIPIPNINSSFCGTVINSLSDLIFVQPVKKATNYEYKLTEKGTSNIYYWNNTNYRVCLSWFGSTIKYNTIYELQARAYVDGIWGVYSPICEITTPNIPVPNVTTAVCGSVLNSLNQVIYFNNVLKATSYEYRITEQGTTNTYYWNNSIYRVQLSWFGANNIKPNTIYELQARANVNGVWGNYGSSCQITTPDVIPLSELNENARLMSNNEMEAGVITPVTTLNIYPNPNTGELLNVSLNNLSPNSVLTLTDIYGKVILNKPLNTELSEYTIEVKFDNKLASGLYFINIISDGNRITEKLIVR